jgi:competence protein ComEC
VSIAAQLALLPLLLQIFHRAAFAALLLNLVAVPLSTAVLLAGSAVIAASAVSAPLASGLGSLAWVSARALVVSGSVVRWAPAFDLRLPTPSPAAVAVYVVGLLLMASGRRTGIALSLTGVGLLGFVTGSAVAPGDGRLRMDVVDVGQGDCLVLHSPSGRVLVVDTGGVFDHPFDFGESVVGPHLWAGGVRAIDHLILTHGHPDHVGAVPFLLRNFHPGDVWEGPAPSNDPIYRELDAFLQDSRVRRRTVVRGLSTVWDGVRLEVLAPTPPTPRPLRTRNDDSVVVRVQLGETAFLLTGDLEGHGESRLVGVSARASVLKVPHHGSRTSSTPHFIEGVGPRAAVISVGFQSSFGHPHAEVIERYAQAGIRLFRTDLDGTVTFSTDGRQLWVETTRTGLRERLR